MLAGAMIVVAYLLGALSGGLLVGRLLGRGDLRTAGSGNAGATNALRTGGAVYGVAVLLFDVAKGVLAVCVLPAAPALDSFAWLAFACGAAAVVGHVWPVYFGFRGGKGAATLIGTLLGLMPLALLPALLVWVATLVLTGFVSLSILLGMTAIVVLVIYWHAVALLWAPSVLFAVGMWILVMYTHRANIRRLLDGSENRFERAMLLRQR